MDTHQEIFDKTKTRYELNHVYTNGKIPLVHKILIFKDKLDKQPSLIPEYSEKLERMIKKQVKETPGDKKEEISDIKKHFTLETINME